MSEKQSVYRSGAYAAYMASRFSSAARLCAHEADFIAARVQVLHAVGEVTAEDSLSVRAMAQSARSQELKASEAADSSHDSSRRGLPYEIVASHTSATLGHWKSAHNLEDLASELERMVIGRRKSPLTPCRSATGTISVWNVPAQGRARLALECGSIVGRALAQRIAIWAGKVQPRDQLLICVSTGGGRIVQVARPPLHTDTWPWTIRVLPGRLCGDDGHELPQGLVSTLINRRFVSHFDRGLWCHVAPRQPNEFGDWLAAVVDAVAVLP